MENGIYLFFIQKEENYSHSNRKEEVMEYFICFIVYINLFWWRDFDLRAQCYKHAVRYPVDSSHIHSSGGIPSHIYSKARDQTCFPRGRSSLTQTPHLVTRMSITEAWS